MGKEKSIGKVSDADRGNWVDHYAPAALRPYLRLARADRPIGSWLLFLPCLWSLLLALVSDRALLDVDAWQPTLLIMLWLVSLFGVGSVTMRGAGCTYNDIVDADIDARVARTRSRPIPSGQVSKGQAILFLVLQCLAGLFVLLQFNSFAILLGISSILVVLVYPFMKRVTNWPQAVLGAAFAWGALMGWAVIKGELSLAPVLLYLGTVMWIIGYDTIYAHQDVEDDALLGLKSTALNFGQQTQGWLVIFYSVALLLFVLAGYLVGAGLVFFIGMAVAGVHLLWQIWGLDIDDADDCLKRFKSNRDFGLLVALALVAEVLFVCANVG